jgi:hypothetical protein
LEDLLEEAPPAPPLEAPEGPEKGERGERKKIIRRILMTIAKRRVIPLGGICLLLGLGSPTMEERFASFLSLILKRLPKIYKPLSKVTPGRRVFFLGFGVLFDLPLFFKKKLWRSFIL